MYPNCLLHIGIEVNWVVMEIHEIICEM